MNSTKYARQSAEWEVGHFPRGNLVPKLWVDGRLRRDADAGADLNQKR